MKWTSRLVVTLALASCGHAEPPSTVDSLLGNPERLKEVMRQCHEDGAKMGDQDCAAASEAFRRRFMGDGKGQYTPQR
jgi:hypothetical protein